MCLQPVWDKHKIHNFRSCFWTLNFVNSVIKNPTASFEFKENVLSFIYNISTVIQQFIDKLFLIWMSSPTSKPEDLCEDRQGAAGG